VVSGGGGIGQVQVERSQGAILVQLAVDASGGVSTLYGRNYSVPTIAFTFLDPGDLRSPIRHWEFSDSVLPPQETIRASRFYRVGDKVVVLVTGVNLKLGPITLSSDNRRHAHLVVLQE
jgi:hypothetical protein